MARIESLSILTETGDGKAYLAEEYGKVVQNVQNGTIASLFKNMDLSGDPTAGSIEAKRFANAVLNDVGTARTNGAGQKIKAGTVTVPINISKELIEEVADKDVRLFGVQGLVERRLANHQMRIIKFLEKTFWAEAVTGGTKLVSSAEEISDKCDELIIALETTKTNYVDGVPRELMGLILSPTYYTALQNKIDTLPGIGGGTYNVFHNVRVFSSTDLPSGTDAIAICEGAIAEPVHYTPDQAGKIPLSNSYHFGIFIDAGCKTVSPELVRYLAAS